MIKKLVILFFVFFLSYAESAESKDLSLENEEPVRGLIKGIQEVWISTDLNARVAEIFKREGEPFKKGDALISFDCLEFVEKLNSIKLDQQLEEENLKNAKELNKHKAIGKFELRQAELKVQKAKAEVASLQAHIRDCAILAPFNGRVAEVKNYAFETISPGQPFMKIVSTDLFEIELIVPSNFLRWIKPGVQFIAFIDETSQKYEAVVERVGGVVDSTSQTVKIIGSFLTKSSDILPGMSLTASFQK